LSAIGPGPRTGLPIGRENWLAPPGDWEGNNAMRQMYLQ
jgi:hypothetical protein